MTNRAHDRLVKTALGRPSVKKEYDALKGEFDLLEEMLAARLKACGNVAIIHFMVK
jgi:hypothetical protein